MWFIWATINIAGNVVASLVPAWSQNYSLLNRLFTTSSSLPPLHYLLFTTSSSLPPLHYLLFTTSSSLPPLHYLLFTTSSSLPPLHYLLFTTSSSLPPLHYLLFTTSSSLPPLPQQALYLFNAVGIFSNSHLLYFLSPFYPHTHPQFFNTNFPYFHSLLLSLLHLPLSPQATTTEYQVLQSFILLVHFSVSIFLFLSLAPFSFFPNLRQHQSMHN